MEPLKTINYKGCTIEIHHDEDPGSPRTEWDNAGTMLCKHRNYILGDRKRGEPEPTADEIIEVTQRKDVLWLPLYLYDHSGITIRTGAAHGNWTERKGVFAEDGAGWDTSTVGIIYITKEKAVKEWGKKRYTKAVEKAALECLEGEVLTYDSYLTGSVVGFVAKDEDGEDIDSCWGFYPDRGTNVRYEDEHKYMIEEAKDNIDHYLKKKAADAKELAHQTALYEQEKKDQLASDLALI